LPDQFDEGGREELGADQDEEAVGLLEPLLPAEVLLALKDEGVPLSLQQLEHDGLKDRRRHARLFVQLLVAVYSASVAL
jgi:hypothetical protein